MRAKGITKQKIAEKEAAEQARIDELAERVSYYYYFGFFFLSFARELT